MINSIESINKAHNVFIETNVVVPSLTHNYWAPLPVQYRLPFPPPDGCTLHSPLPGSALAVREICKEFSATVGRAGAGAEQSRDTGFWGHEGTVGAGRPSGVNIG